MKPDSANFATFKYAEATKDHVTTLCNPLFSLNINMFTYFQLFNDGRRFFLGTNLDLLSFCLQSVQYLESVSLGEEIYLASKSGYHAFFWPTQKSDPLMEALYELNIWNGFSIHKRSEDGSMEGWGFGTDRNAENMRSFFIENVELLKDFTTFFTINAKEMLGPPKTALALFQDFNKLPVIGNYEAQKIKEFIKATPINKRPIVVNGKEIFLSSREAQYLNFLATGQTAKQIALNLNASPRTAEKHLENIKHKIGHIDKESLINAYRKSVLNWL